MNTLKIQTINLFIVINPVNLKVENQIKKFIENLSNPVFRLHILQSKNQGVNCARQMGLNACRSDLVFYFDDDCELENRNLLLNHIHLHTMSPHAHAIGGCYAYKSHSHFFSIFNSVANKYYFNLQKKWYKEGLVDLNKKRSAYLLGGNFSIKRNVFLKENIEFDQTIKFGGTEKDFFLNAYKKDLFFLQTELDIFHYYNSNLWNYLRKIKKQGRGNAYIKSKGLFFTPQYPYKIHKPFIISYLFDSAFWLGFYSLNKNWTGFIKNRSTGAFNELKILKNKIRTNF